MSMKLTFLGATGTVTGSKTLLEYTSPHAAQGTQSVLIDCGLFQGYKQLRLRNREPLPFQPAALSGVVLTHAHIDHSGYLPLLAKNGFRGNVWCTEATAELCAILLPDSGHLQEEEAEYANRGGFSRHSPALPLYTEAEARKALRLLTPLPLGREFSPAAGLSARFWGAGHILGAAGVSLTAEGRTLSFSGDLGRPNDPIMCQPQVPAASDWLVLESTYGNRRHDHTDPTLQLAEVVNRTIARGGKVVIPAFAVGRAQSLLFYLWQLKLAGKIPKGLPVYLNSPMAVDATALYVRFHAEHRLSHEDCRAMCTAAQIINTPEQSKRLNERREPMVIIAASGMATGGRVVHHLKAMAPDARNTILLSGFQAGGTRGARLLAGEPSIKIHGEQVPVRAEVASLHNLSAHADADELLQWLRRLPQAPQQLLINHGEPEAADALRLRIQQELGWNCRVPDYRDVIELG